MYKIKRIQLYLIILVSVLMQIGILNRLKLFGVMPDLVLIVIILLSLHLGSSAGLETGVIAGFLVDIFTLDFFWINTLILAVMGIMAGSLRYKFSRESKRAVFALIFFSTAVSMSFHYFLEFLISRNVPFSYVSFLCMSIIPAGVITGLLSLPVHLFLTKVYRLMETEDYL